MSDQITAHSPIESPMGQPVVRGHPGEMGDREAYLTCGGLGPLVNDRPNPNVHIFREQPEHRLMVYMKAKGWSNKDIAKAMNYSATMVAQVLRQPAMRQLLVELVHAAGFGGVEALLKGEGENSIATLIDIRDNDKMKESVRVAAANSILDRVLGKAVQKVETKVYSGSMDELKQVQELEAELAATRAEAATLVGGNFVTSN